jgi:hypothetical protein
MNENLNQPEQDSTQDRTTFPGISGSLSNQDAVPSADLPNGDSPYEDSPVPYLSLPSKSAQQTSPPSGATSQGADTSSSSLPADTAATSPSTSGIGVLIGVILGALLGGMFGHVTAGSVLMWGSIGAVVGGVIALLPYVLSQEVVPGLLMEGLSTGVDELFHCCPISAILVVVSVVTISGLLLWQSLLLAALEAGSILIIMLIGVSFALLK